MKRHPGLLFLSAVVFLSVARGLGARDVAGPDWPPITPEEMALKDDPLNPGAPAMILYRGMHDDDKERLQWHLYRYKIFKEEGRKYADVEIPYSEKGAKFVQIHARTVQPDGKEVPFAVLIYDKVIVKSKKLKYQAKTFTLPEVLPGSIIEYSYKIKFRDSFPDELKNPGMYIFTSAYTRLTAIWTIDHNLSTRRLRFSLRPLGTARLAWLWLRLPSGKVPTKQPDGTIVLELADVRAFHEENYIPPEPTLKGQVFMYYKIGSGSFWYDYAEQSKIEIDKFLDKKKALVREVKRITSPSDSPDTKLRKIYARAQQVRALSYERDRTAKEEKKENLKENKNVEDILKRGYARANEINQLFVGLARAAGFEASIVKLTARESSLFIPRLPLADQLNAIVASVWIGGQERFFDPATLNCPFDLLPWAETDAHGVRLAGSGGIMVSTPKPTSAEAIIERTASLELNTTGTIQGKVEVVYTGHDALERRLENSDTDAAGRRKALEDEVKAWLPLGATVELKNEPAWDVSDMKLKAEFQVAIPELGISTAKRRILPLGIFQARNKHPFPNARRVHPIYFRHPFQIIDDISLKVPEGYEVESLPAPRTKVFPFCRYEISRTNQGNTVHLERSLVMDGYFIKVEGYSKVRIFYDSVRAGDEEQIVLKTVEVAQAQ